MFEAEDYSYHLQRQQHCLAMARRATEPGIARLHGMLAAAHGSRLAEIAAGADAYLSAPDGPIGRLGRGR